MDVFEPVNAGIGWIGEFIKPFILPICLIIGFIVMIPVLKTMIESRREYY